MLSNLHMCTLVAYIAKNIDPDQTAPLGAVGYGSIQYACKLELIRETCNKLPFQLHLADSLSVRMGNGIDPDQTGPEEAVCFVVDSWVKVQISKILNFRNSNF